MENRNFKITSEFKGYVNKREVTNLPPGFLIAGSQNVLSTDGDTVGIRQGYTLVGAANTALTPVESSYEWKTNRGDEWPVRGFGTKLQFKYTDDVWYDLLTGLSSVDFNFTEFWNTSRAMDVLLFVNGESNIREWTGGVTTFASATINTITKEGSTTWAEEGFTTTGSIIIGGTTYTYSGGSGTTTLTGVAPDPTAAGHAVGTVAYQAPISTANSAMTGIAAAFPNDLIATLDNRVYVGSFTYRDIYLSKTNSYTDYSFATPRIPGDGALLRLDGTPTAFAPQENLMYISAGQDYWYKVVLTLSADLVNESAVIQRLKTDTQGAAKSQAMVGLMKNKIVFVSNEPTFDFLGRVENVDTPQAVPLSDPIKNDFDDLDFTNAHVKYFKNNIYIALPAESKLLIYNVQKGFWEAPQILPVRRLAIIDGDIHFHSNAVPETYKLFDGYSDNTNPIDAKARFSYMNFGDRAWQKVFTEWLSEGKIQSNTEIIMKLFYEFNGYETLVSETIAGSDSTIVLSSSTGSLGKQSLGKSKLGGGAGGDEYPKFRVKHTEVPVDFFEMTVEYSSNDVDQRWEIIAFGPDVKFTTSDDASIKK